jgi:hypothetical protein
MQRLPSRGDWGRRSVSVMGDRRCGETRLIQGLKLKNICFSPTTRFSHSVGIQTSHLLHLLSLCSSSISLLDLFSHRSSLPLFQFFFTPVSWSLQLAAIEQLTHLEVCRQIGLQSNYRYKNIIPIK